MRGAPSWTHAPRARAAQAVKMSKGYIPLQGATVVPLPPAQYDREFCFGLTPGIGLSTSRARGT